MDYKKRMSVTNYLEGVLRWEKLLWVLTVSSIILAISQKIFLVLDTYDLYNNNLAQFNDAGLYFLVFPYFICITTFRNVHLLVSIIIMDIIAYISTILIEKYYYPELYMYNLIPMAGWLMNDFAILFKFKNVDKTNDLKINLFKNLDFIFFIVLFIKLIVEFITNQEDSDDFVFNYLNLRVTILLYEFLFDAYISELIRYPIFWLILGIRIMYQILVSLYESDGSIFDYNVLQYYNSFYCLVEFLFLISVMHNDFKLNRISKCHFIGDKQTSERVIDLT